MPPRRSWCQRPKEHLGVNVPQEGEEKRQAGPPQTHFGLQQPEPGQEPQKGGALVEEPFKARPFFCQPQFVPLEPPFLLQDCSSSLTQRPNLGLFSNQGHFSLELRQPM